MKGHLVNKSTRLKISKRLKGKILWNKNKKFESLSDEHKQKISNSLTGHLVDKKTKLKISKANKGNFLSDEHKQKLREYQAENKKVYKICQYCNKGISKREYIRGHERKCLTKIRAIREYENHI